MPTNAIIWMSQTCGWYYPWPARNDLLKLAKKLPISAVPLTAEISEQQKKLLMTS